MIAAEIYIYYEGKPEEAKKLLNPIVEVESKVQGLAEIRLGDLAFIEKDMNLANEFWSSQ